MKPASPKLFAKGCSKTPVEPAFPSPIEPQQLVTAATRFIANAFWLAIIRR